MKLDQLADAMHAHLAPVQKGYVERALFGGLHIVLERKGDQWRLAIARTTKAPSKTEAKVIAAAFKLPAGVEWAWTQRTQKAKRGHPIKWNVAECIWIERQPDKGTQA